MTKIEDFGAKADLTRITVTVDVTGGNPQVVTASSATFTVSDVGKLICIKKARDVSSYSSNKATLTAEITAFNSATSVQIDTAADFDVTDGDAYFYTNNYDAIVDAIDDCSTNGVGLLFAESEGVFGIDPFRATTPPSPLYDDFRDGIRLPSCSLNIKGAGKGITHFKWCIEDDFQVDLNDRIFFSGFVIGEKGEYAFEDFTMLAPDRITTEIINDRCCGIYVYNMHHHASDPTNGTVTIRNVDIIGDEEGSAEYAQLQWGYGTYMSTPNSDLSVLIDNVTIKASTQGVSQFDSVSNKQYLEIKDINIYFTGSPLLKKGYEGGSGFGASMTLGSPTITVSNIDGFSFYDFVENGSRDLTVYLDNGTNQLTAKITSISSPTTATLDTNANDNYTDVNLQPGTTVGNTRYGHASYIHPSITLNIDGYKVFYTVGYRMHVYSGSGTSGGKFHLYNDLGFYDEDNPYMPGFVGSEGFSFSSATTELNVIRNSEIILQAVSAAAVDYKFYDTVFYDPASNGVVFYGNVDIVGCVIPSVYQYGDGKTVNVINSQVAGRVAGRFGGVVNTYSSYYGNKRIYLDSPGDVNSYLNMTFKADELVFKYMSPTTGLEVPGAGGLFTSSPQSAFYLANVMADDHSVLVLDAKSDQAADVLRVRDSSGNNKVTITNKFGLKMNTKTDTFSPPKLTDAERGALTPVAGDIIYNTTTNKHQGYDGTTWNNMY